MAQHAEAKMSDCPRCGSTKARVTIEFSPPVIIDDEVMVQGEVVSAECKDCHAGIEIPPGHMVTYMGEVIGDDEAL